MAEEKVKLKRFTTAQLLNFCFGFFADRLLFLYVCLPHSALVILGALRW